MSKHTKGPWRATFRGVDQDANWASRIPYAIERELGNCVQPIADICDQPQAEANAHLIAAAPDLLVALTALYDAQGSCVELTPEIMRAARDAIKKSTGEPV